MKGIFSIIGKIIFVLMFVEIIKAIWNSSIIGKLFILTMIVIGVYHSYFGQPTMLHLPR